MKHRILSVFLAVVLLTTTMIPPSFAEDWFSEEHEHSYYCYVKVNPTCTECGEEVFECDCGDSYSTVIPPHGHEFMDGVCTRCGMATEVMAEMPEEDAVDEYDLPEDQEEAIPEVVGKAIAKVAESYQAQQLTLEVSKSVKTTMNQTDTLLITSTLPVDEWKTSKADIASISPDGNACTVTANKVGSAKITAVSGKKKIVITLTVKDPYLPTGVSVDAEHYSATMVAGETQSLSGALKLEPAWATTTYTWKSSNKKIVKVNKEGNITALKAGKANITATTKNKKKTTMTIQVLPNKLDSICAAPGKDVIDSVAGSWTLQPKSVEIAGGKVVCEFYVVNGTTGKSKTITNLNLTVAVGSKDNVIASQSFAKVKAALKKNAVKTIKVTMTQNVNAGYNLSEYSADQIYYLLDEGVLRNPVIYGIPMGFDGTQPAKVVNMQGMLNVMPRDAVWYYQQHGMKDLSMIAAAVAAGAQIVRVGFEDSIYYAPNCVARTNAELVSEAAKVIRAIGYQVATVDEAREIIGLRGVSA